MHAGTARTTENFRLESWLICISTASRALDYANAFVRVWPYNSTSAHLCIPKLVLQESPSHVVPDIVYWVFEVFSSAALSSGPPGLLPKFFNWSFEASAAPSFGSWP